jgi:hypothetical protein
MHKQGDRQFRVAKPSPATAIPPRASAHAGKVVRSGSRYIHTDPLPVDSDITRIPTIPEPASRVSERNTSSRINDLVDVNTAPTHVSPDISCRDTVEHASVTYTQYMDGAKSGSGQRHLFRLDPLERVRWWLLYPGRIEFLLLAGGTLLLLAITTLLVLVMALSLGILN